MTFLVKQLNLHFDKFAGNNECLKKKSNNDVKYFITMKVNRDYSALS